MEKVVLTLEITGELDEKLREIADRDLVTREDVALGILATTVARAKLRTGPFGLSLKARNVFISGAVSAVMNAVSAQKEEDTAKKGA